ncbi:NUDIX domain-containing protein [Nocardia sp. CA-107356]|uniref:NUDIX domain-containing protein n=1 Tax=Nocardia sp. CA-107356 TaxID=3239972 RepID=UPI003D8C068B
MKRPCPSSQQVRPHGGNYAEPAVFPDPVREGREVMSDRDEQLFAQVRLAAGGLFVRGEAVLLVHPAEQGGWDIPGGIVEPGESPAAACHREIREELGLDRPPQRLLVHDWAPKVDKGGKADKGDKILYIFDCGELGDESAIELQHGELDRWQWARIDTIDTLVRPRSARRVWQAFRARMEGHAVYLEHGEPTFVHPGTEVSAPSWLDRQADRDRHLG